MRWYWYRFWAYLMRVRVVHYVYIWVWAVVHTVGSVFRYLAGIRERVRMGMTAEQAADRSYRTEIRQIEDRVTEWKNQTDLARYRIEQIRKTVSERDSGNGRV